jgi:hypothetical protein
MTQALPSYARLHELFEYRDGDLYWKKLSSSLSRTKVGKKAGMVGTRGYWRIKVDNKTYMAHRLIYAMHNDGECPNFIDHIDNNTSNNRIENLRTATNKQNALNAKNYSTNKSTAKNVSWCVDRQKWRVYLSVYGKRKFFGSYDDLELADLVAIEARDKYHGEFANHG